MAVSNEEILNEIADISLMDFVQIKGLGVEVQN
jgi:hypothetical protein